MDEAIANKKWELEYMTMNMKIQEEREEARIEENIRVQRKYKVTDEEIVHGLMDDFNLTEDEAWEKLQEYDNEND